MKLIKPGVYTPLHVWSDSIRDSSGKLFMVDYEVNEHADKTLGGYARIHRPFNTTYVGLILNMYTEGQNVFKNFTDEHTSVGIFYRLRINECQEDIYRVVQLMMKLTYMEPFYIGMDKTLNEVNGYLKSQIVPSKRR